MRSNLLILTLLISTLALGQSKDSIQFRRFKIGVTFSPDYCYRILKYDPSNKWVQDLRNDEEEPIFGFTTGFGIKMNLTNRVVLETGLFYSIKGQQTRNTDLVWTAPNADLPVKSKTQYHFKYIDIPLKAQYFFGNRKIKYFLSAGVSFNIFSEKATKVVSEFEDGHTTSENSIVDLGYLKFNLAAIIGCGIRYDATERISISAEPVYRQFINSIVADKKAKEYPYSIGTNFAVYYSLKKKS